MKRYFSPSTQGFYVDDINYENLPADIVEITPEQHDEFLNAINISNKEVYLNSSKKLVTRDRVVPTTWSDITSKRNRLLAKSDFTQMADWPGDKVAWANYRQQLRDIPQNFETPASVIWPTPPGE